MKTLKVAIIPLLVVLAAYLLAPLAAQIPGPTNGTGPAGPKALIHRAEAAKETEILEKSFKVALLVGIGDYDSSVTGIPELNYPVSDIRVVAKTLKLQGYTPIILTDRQATASRIRQQLKYMADEVEPGKGTAIFYFSGHGFRIGGENFLATYDTTLDQLAAQGLSVSEVQKLLAATGAKQRVLFIDACRNDPSAKGIGTTGRPFEQFEDSEGLRILYSTGPGKVSYEDEALEQGVFSYYVAKGLRGEAAGPDGMITFDDLRSWVSDNMRRYGAEHQRPQIPYQLGESTGDFLLARKASSDVIGLADTPPPAPTPPPPTPTPGGGGRVVPPTPAPPVNPDPPARVARISLTEGTVTLQPAGVQEWAAAEINRPLTTGDSLWVDEIGHAEVEIANGALRLSEKTGFTILNLDDHTTQIKLTQGNLSVRLTRVNPGELVEVDTPNTAVAIKKAGSYQLKVSATGDTSVVTVTDGSVEASAGARNVTLAKNQSATVSGIQSPTVNVSTPTGAEHDRYFDARDRRPESMSSAYVADGMVGTADLDDNGTWLSVRGYGMAWIPRVQKGWEPYRFGHWAWVDPWGWSWVDDQPWGFAPFHYGRWIQVDVGWAWLPGGAGMQAAYSPALVAWSGVPGANPAAAGAGVGWFPLGPNEVYVPSYNASSKYMNMVNATSVNVANVNVTRVNPTQANYMYRTNPTMVSRDTFVSGGHVSDRNMMPVSRTDMARSRVSNFSGAAPQKESVLGRSDGRQRISQPPAAVMNRTVVARTTPPPPPAPFAMQERSLANGQGRPMSPMERQRVQPAQRTDVLPAASRGMGREPVFETRPSRETAVETRPGRESAVGVRPGAPVPENPRAPQAAKPMSPIEQQRADRAAAQAAALEKQKEARAAAVTAQQEALKKRQEDMAAAKAAQQKALADRQAAAKEAAAQAAAPRTAATPPARTPPPPARPAPVKPPPPVKPVVPPQ